MHWLTTAPNPRTSATGVDAGQRGWRLHAIKTENENFSEIRFVRAACGLLPSHGWSLDIFIEDKCTRCARALEKSEAA
jgi:ubiquinone biosynthesis protein COQ9